MMVGYKETEIGLIPEEWEVLMVQEFTEITSSKRILQSEYVETGIPFYRGKEITQKSKGHEADDLVYITERLFFELSTKFGAPVQGDMLITAVGTIGKVYLVKKEDKFYFKDGNLIWLRRINEKVDANFLKYYFTSEIFQKAIEVASSGSSQKALTIVKFKILSVGLPKKKEQQKIAAILSTVDDKIDVIEEKIKETQQLKQSLMQTLLTKGIGHTKFKASPLGEIPESWETMEVQSFAKITTGGKDTQNRVDDGQYPFFVRSQTIERINSFSFDGEAILTAGDGVGVGKVFHYINGKFDYHQRVYNICNFKANVSGRYFFEYFRQNFIKQVRIYNAKGSVDSVRRDMIAKMLVPIPPFKEQIFIATTLSSMDDKLSILQEKKSEYTQLKKGLMQQLLTGKIRVNHLVNE